MVVPSFYSPFARFCLVPVQDFPSLETSFLLFEFFFKRFTFLLLFPFERERRITAFHYACKAPSFCWVLSFPF